MLVKTCILKARKNWYKCKIFIYKSFSIKLFVATWNDIFKIYHKINSEIVIHNLTIY